MMGRRFLLLFCGLVFLSVVDVLGQTEDGSWKDGYTVSYVKTNELRRNGNHLYFINIDLEWPERLNGSALLPLQTFLCRQLFREEASTLRCGYRQFLSDMGERLTVVPDEAGLKNYYITCNLKVLDYDRRGYVSLRVFFLREPKDASEKPEEYQRLLTYDLINERILSATDILNSNMLKDLETRVSLVEMLFYQAYGENMYDLDNIALTLDACLLQGDVLFSLGESRLGDKYHDLAILPSNLIDALLTKNARRLLLGTMKPAKNKDKKEQPSSVVECEEEVLPDSMKIYSAVDEMPVFSFDGKGIPSYISKHMAPSSVEMPTGRAIVSFVVEKNGTLSDIAVLKSLSPTFDRNLVRILRNMPAWKPGMIGGQPVRTNIVLPINFQPQG